MRRKTAGRDFGEKFDELFKLFSQAVGEMGGQQRYSPNGFPRDAPEARVSLGDEWLRFTSREAITTLAGRTFTLAAARVQAPAYKSGKESGVQAKACLFAEDDRKLAEFRLHSREWAWKLVRNRDSLALADVDAETIRRVLTAALVSAHE